MLDAPGMPHRHRRQPAGIVAEDIAGRRAGINLTASNRPATIRSVGGHVLPCRLGHDWLKEEWPNPEAVY